MTKVKMTRHHKRSRSQGGNNDLNNISHVSEVRHRAWHTLFSGDRSIESIVEELNRVWIDGRYKLVIRANYTRCPNCIGWGTVDARDTPCSQCNGTGSKRR